MVEELRPEVLEPDDLEGAEGELKALRQVTGAPGDGHHVEVMLMDTGEGARESIFLVVKDVDGESAHIPLPLARHVAAALMDFARAAGVRGNG